LFWFLVLFLFISVTLLVLAGTGRFIGSPEERIEKYGYGPGSFRATELKRPLFERIIKPIFRWISEFGVSLTPARIRSGVERRLAIAGNPFGLQGAQFVTIAIISATVVTVLYILMNASTSRFGLKSDNIIIALVIFIVIGYFIPKYWLDQMVSRRQRAIEKALPDTLDLIVVCVEAGLTLEAALARVVVRSDTPLARELEIALDEMSLGKTKAVALREAAKRTGVTDFHSVIAALVQADEVGSSIAEVLRVQAESTRIRRRQQIQAQAIEAPVKMLFPLMIFLLPALFAVTIGPAALAILRVFGALLR
jgi:tight adherence protein C